MQGAKSSDGFVAVFSRPTGAGVRDPGAPEGRQRGLRYSRQGTLPPSGACGERNPASGIHTAEPRRTRGPDAMEGMFGAAAGMWMYDQFSGNRGKGYDSNDSFGGGDFAYDCLATPLFGGEAKFLKLAFDLVEIGAR